jgi:hypothetical protein
LEKSAGEDRDMSAVAATTLRDYAAREWPRLNHKARLAKLARLLPWSGRRVRAIYNGETGVSLRAEEQADLDALTRVEEANRHDYQALQARIARLEAALFAQDEEFHREQMAALRGSIDGGRGSHVARALERVADDD